ncbi:MAG: penicillin-binding protein 2 [Eubacteriales bacterium]|nr:penicillin-binding protein 2 [Sarcina sp.]MBR2730086.1 penicillin-binding protein 2 [Lachnospiraceae bacterium]MDO4417675.1 penicillin-binding protein 2 [Eubacteriales bacterium]
MKNDKGEGRLQTGSAARHRIRRGPRRFTISMQKRLMVLFILILAAFVFLGFRLFMIQRDNGRSYTMQVLSQQAYDNKTLPYKRGRITDAKGTVLADSQLVYNVIIDAKQMLEKPEYLEPSLDAAERLGLDKEEIRTYVTDHPGSQYYIARKNLPYQEKRNFDMEVAEGIEKEEAAQREQEAAVKKAEEEGAEIPKTDPVELVYSNIKGIWFEDNYIRTYPCNTLAADVIGFTAGNSDGAYGVEEYYDDVLRGVEGRTYGYLDESLNMEQTTIQPSDGNNLVLTIDANIQSICEKYLKEFNEEYKDNKHKGNGTNNAACIIMDIDSGGILAMASEPGFDLNDPFNIDAVAGMPKLDEEDTPTSSYLTLAEARNLSDADKTRYLRTLWNNFCVGNHFEPGSTAKPFTTAAGLESGTLKREDTFLCTGQLLVGDTWIKCAHLEGDGILDVAGAIERSCNVALMQEAAKIGNETFCKFQNIYNFGLRTNVDLAGEARTDGYLYTADAMSEVDLASNSFGQNFEVTMIQMITGFNSLINGGNYYQPHVVDRITSAGGSTVQSNAPRVLKKTVSEETSSMIRQYCIQAVEGDHGTGKLARPAGYRIGGKTGTAETLPRGNGQYVVSFLGFAPAEDPQICIYVVLDRINKKKQDEAGRACQVTRKILTEVLPYMNIYMTEPVSDEEKLELEELGLYDTNERVPEDEE